MISVPHTLYRKNFQVIMGLSKEDTIGVIAGIVEIVLIALLIGLLILVMLLRRRLYQKRQRLLALLKKNSHNNVRPIEDEYDYCKAAETTIVDNGDQEDTGTSNCIKSTVVDVQVHLSANECYSYIRNNSIINDNTYEIIDDYCKAKTTIVENSDQEDITSNNIKSTVADVQVHLENGNDSYEIIDYLHADSMHLPDCYLESPDCLTVLPSSQAKLEEQHADDHYTPLSELTLTSETSYATVDTCAARVK